MPNLTDMYLPEGAFDNYDEVHCSSGCCVVL